MRHAKKNNHLSRKAPHRKAMLSNMACSLIKHKRIKTTLAKAKALRVYLEPLITKSKNDTTHSRRVVFSYLKQKEVVTELFGDIATKITDRPGGYTRIIRLANRIGDNSKICFIELVDYNEVYVKDSVDKKSKRRRSRSKTKSQIESSNNESSPKISETEVSSEANLDVSTSSETSDLSHQAKSVADSNSDEKDSETLNTEKKIDSNQKPDEK
ncbi:50S ribosomal protein L17 [Bacteroidota bacterium]|nr:50S ribosomal protein L17 [Bacteroidota bacterium]